MSSGRSARTPRRPPPLSTQHAVIHRQKTIKMKYYAALFKCPTKEPCLEHHYVNAYLNFLRVACRNGVRVDDDGLSSGPGEGRTDPAYRSYRFMGWSSILRRVHLASPFLGRALASLGTRDRRRSKPILDGLTDRNRAPERPSLSRKLRPVSRFRSHHSHGKNCLARNVKPYARSWGLYGRTVRDLRLIPD